MPRSPGSDDRLERVKTVAAVVLSVVAVFLLYRAFCGGAGADPFKTAYYACDACGETFEEDRQLPPIECPKCHKKAGVYLRWMECRKCGKRFEGLRHRPVPGREDEFLPKDLMDMPQLQVKLRDGEWVGPGSEEGLAVVRASFVCPFCNTRDARVVGPPAVEAKRKKR